MFDAGLPEAAGRTAYMAAFHAAQALLFERRGKVFKTHTGVHGEFGHEIRTDPRFDDAMRAFLGRGYRLKSIADYDVEPDSEVSVETATVALAEAERFVAIVASVLEQ